MKKIKNLSDINIRSGLNLLNSNEIDFISINKNKNIKERNLSNKNIIPSIKLSPNNGPIKKIEDDNSLYKKSSTYNIGEGETSFTINNFNDSGNNKNSIYIKSKTCKEENINKLNLQYRFNNNICRFHLDAVLETINEVSNSRVDSSDLSEDKNNNQKNDEERKVNKKEINNKKIKKEEIFKNKGNDSDNKNNDT